MVVDISCDIEGCLLKGRLSIFSSVLDVFIVILAPRVIVVCH